METYFISKRFHEEDKFQEELRQVLAKLELETASSEAAPPEVKAAKSRITEANKYDHRSKPKRQYVTVYWDGENVGIDEDQHYQLSESQIKDLDDYVHSILSGECHAADIRHVETDWGVTDIIIIPSRYIDDDDHVVWI